VGHALGALAAGWGVGGVRGAWRGPALYAALGVLPDADLLVGLHSMYSHSVGAAAAVALSAALVPANGRARLGGGSRIGFALACGAAYASHIFLDWLGSDTTPPIGIMALWPLTQAYYQSDLHWFLAISRRYWLPSFWTLNAAAAVREIVLLAPPVLLVWWLRGGRRTWARTTD
jgi:hypothetical protein